MNPTPRPATIDVDAPTTELLILPDGRILVHNLTPLMASMLSELNPEDHAIKPRLAAATTPTSGLTDEAES